MPRSGCEIKTAIEIKKVLEIHIPAAQLGRPFLGTSITAVSICIMPSVHECDNNDKPRNPYSGGAALLASGVCVIM